MTPQTPHDWAALGFACASLIAVLAHVYNQVDRVTYRLARERQQDAKRKMIEQQRAELQERIERLKNDHPDWWK
jgi:uncharacterized membrane protein YcjF (UPF0283 family)